MQVPEQYGGAGVDDFRFNQILDEEVGIAGIGGAGLGVTLHNDICLPYFLHFADEEQKRRWLPGIADGSLITALAMTEPEIGSDLAGLRTTASRDGDSYVVNGSKTFITNGINADLVITAVKTDPDPTPCRDLDPDRRAGDGGLRARSQPGEARACTPRTPPSCSSQMFGCRPRTCSARWGRAFAT